MNVNFINPFLVALQKVLSDMAGMSVTPGKPFLKKDSLSHSDITGVIGLAGENIRGSLAVSFPEPAILQIASKMLGETYTTIDPMVIDITSEIVNMVLGSAKADLSEQGYKFEMTLPMTIAGRNHSFAHKTTGPVVVVPFETEHGTMRVEICLEG